LEFMRVCEHGQGEVRMKGEPVGTDDFKVFCNPVCLNHECQILCGYNKPLERETE
jgi:hypothetical protein